MSSEISTDKTQGLQPWQFFVLAGLGCATAATFIARGRDVTSIILLSVLMGAAALAGLAVLRTLRPLVSPVDDRTVVIGERTRAALEREKMLALRSIKELEFDRAMGKLSDDDWKEMSTRLRARAGRLMRQLDAGAGYRGQIERDLARRLETAPGPKEPAHSRSEEYSRPEDACPAGPTDAPICAQCSTANDSDARFCKACGQALAAS
jgi:hypothetical protein